MLAVRMCASPEALVLGRAASHAGVRLGLSGREEWAGAVSQPAAGPPDKKPLREDSHCWIPSDDIVCASRRGSERRRETMAAGTVEQFRAQKDVCISTFFQIVLFVYIILIQTSLLVVTCFLADVALHFPTKCIFG